MKNWMKIATPILSGLILWLLAVTFFCVAIWLLIADKTASAGTSAGFGTIILFLANLDRIESFKGFGLEAKTRDLREAITDAQSTLARLEEMKGNVASLNEAVATLRAQLDETNTMAERAEILAHLSL
jgi:Tfp pilus assembly protein PilO